MSDQPDFKSELHQTYSNKITTPNDLPPLLEKTPNLESAFNNTNNFSQEQTIDNSYTYTKQTYPMSQAEHLQDLQNTLQPQKPSLWTMEGIQFTVTNCSFTVFLSSIAATIMLYSFPGVKSSELITVFLGQAIGGILIGIATSLVLWHKLKSGESMSRPLGLSNLFSSFANIPIGILIGISLYVIFTNDLISIREFLTVPLRILEMFYWVPFALLPAAIACWGAQVFLVNKYFANSSSGINPAMVSNLPPTKFSVKRSNTAARCDICHRDDMFDIKLSFCRRCQRYTV
ncbi:MAG: hypothetical protein HY819_23805 [Acidobacteria bacterium]|nr:hypothetical protein [Acidobacteriota bacterium]